MFNLIHPLLNKSIHGLSSCILCGIDRQQHHSLCQDCWQQLPWLKSSVQRQEIDIQVACHYSYPMDRIIQKYKYEQQLQFQRLLAETLIALHLPKVQAIVPMPISAPRLAERGYNQSLVIAKILAKHLNVPVWQPISRSDQHSQKGLTRLERIENIEQQFEICTRSKLRYRRVLMLDDVVTTGSSLYALKQKLEVLGCQKIYAACLACAKA